jgi:hypothetical protein
MTSRKRKHDTLVEETPTAIVAEQLHSNIWVSILYFVDPLDLIAVRCVCRKLRTIEQSPEVTQKCWMRFLPYISLLAESNLTADFMGRVSRTTYQKLEMKFKEPLPLLVPPLLFASEPYAVSHAHENGETRQLNDPRECYENLWFRCTLKNHMGHIDDNVFSITYTRKYLKDFCLYELFATLDFSAVTYEPWLYGYS